MRRLDYAKALAGAQGVVALGGVCPHLVGRQQRHLRVGQRLHGETLGRRQVQHLSKVEVFDAFGTRNSVRRARVQAHTTRLQLDDSRQRLYKAIMQAYTQAVGAEKKRDAAAVAVESSRAAFEAMKVKFDNGRATAYESYCKLKEYGISLKVFNNN